MQGATVDGTLDIERLKFTRAVIDETMRLYPPAFLIARAASGPDTIMGLPVKKKDVILIAPWLLHRHEKLWRDPNAFIPSRFMTGTPPDRFAYLPFGVGARVCIGAHFALVEATLALAKMIGAFHVDAGRQGAGDADRRGDDAARPFADVCHHAPVVFSRRKPSSDLIRIGLYRFARRKRVKQQRAPCGAASRTSSRLSA